MEYLLLPAILLILFGPAPSDKTHLADFDRFAKAVGQEITIVDADGIVREGVVRGASPTDVTMQFGTTERIFQRDAVSSASRLRDGRIDGLIKGVVFGMLNALAIVGEPETEGSRGEIWLTTITFWGGVGYLLDAAQSHPQPFYKANMPQPTLKVSLRF